MRSGVTGSHPVESLGGVAGVEPVPLALAMLTYYEPGARWNPKVLSQGESVLALMANTVIARWRPEQAMRTLRAALEGATVLEAPRGEAAETAPLLLEALTQAAV